MLSFETLACCASCGCHARASEVECPHCGAAMRSDGSVRTAASALMRLTAVVVASTTVACSSQDDTGGGTGSGGEGGADAVGVGGAGAASPTTVTSYASTTIAASYGTAPSVGAGPVPTGCAARADEEACRSCCETEHPEGSAVASELYGDGCGCADGSPCLPACSESLCLGDAADEACVACFDSLTGDEACVLSLLESCEQDASCSDWLACVERCAVSY